MLSKERLNNNYDFLRLFAALCIAFTHSYNLLSKNADEPLMKLSGNRFDFSFIGLSIFFSISGYLISKSAATSSSLKNYIWKRFLRIQPMLLLVCIISVFIVGPFFTSFSLTNYYKNIETYTYFQNIIPIFGIQFYLPGVFMDNPAESGINGSLWTLVIEERLYLFLTLIFIFKNKGKLILNYLIVILNVIYFLHFNWFDAHFINYLNGIHVFYALIFLNASLFYFVKINFSGMLNFYLMFFFIVIIMIFSNDLLFEKTFQVVLIPFLVLMFANVKSFTNTVGKYGDFTYGIYVFSFPVQQSLISLKIVDSNPLQLFIYTFLFVITFAFFTWNFFEKKILSFRNKFT